jgi:hypothetical protein
MEQHDDLRASAKRVLSSLVVLSQTGGDVTLHDEPFLDALREWLLEREDPRLCGTTIEHLPSACVDFCEWLAEQP